MRRVSHGCRRFLGALVPAAMVLAAWPCVSHAGTEPQLEFLRDQCLYYSAGYAPSNAGVVTLRHGLYAQAPFPDNGEVDLAASGLALAALPSAVECGIIASNAARDIATNAVQQALLLVMRSAAATNAEQWGAYGYAGMLYHYYVWSNDVSEFRRKPGSDVEVSSVDTTLLLAGLQVCGQYFGEPVLADFREVCGRIAWSNWLDRASPGNSNQFYLSYTTNSGLTGHWNWRSDETSLICIFAALCDSNLDVRTLWNAWERDEVAYTSPPPDPATFSCYASWNGDPFTDFYGLHFLDTERYPPDSNGVDWFQNNSVSYRGHVEFFRKERGYLDGMTATKVIGTANPIAAPKSETAEAPVRTDCPLFSLAGGLPFYSAVPDSNAVAQVLAGLVTNALVTNFFGWHGWPAEAVNATNPVHAVVNDAIIGQDICSIGLSIDNYLTKRVQNLALRDERLRHVLDQVFPPRAVAVGPAGPDRCAVSWESVPGAVYAVNTAPAVTGTWGSCACSTAGVTGTFVTEHAITNDRAYFKVMVE